MRGSTRRLGTIAALALACSVALAQPRPALSAQPIPAFAYYYIWYQPASWNRAKTTYPALGRYSSSDPKIIREQIELAKKAGLGGFIVSWKSTATLNRRLEQLIAIADEEQFKLAIIYQGLDFERQPLPVERIASDLDVFIARYARDKVFDLFDRPLVIWSGTWKYSAEQIAWVTGARRQRLLLLASERNLKGYARVASAVDGDAYYWSSVDPETYPQYAPKLRAMAQAIHDAGGLWIAPMAPGFDARLIGGTRVVERHEGATLRAEMDAALQSSPDALGLISWNEFSENSHVEPSQQYGTRYLDLLTDMHRTRQPDLGEIDSSAPADIQIRPGSLLILGLLILMILASLTAIVRRERRRGS